jgi:hypothetical protein
MARVTSSVIDVSYFRLYSRDTPKEGYGYEFRHVSPGSHSVKLSIFPQRAGAKPNWVKTKTTEVTGASELAELITNNWYAGAIYTGNYATNENFIESSLVVLDYDNKPNEIKLSLEEARKMFASYRCVIATTRNHQKEKVTEAGDIYPAADRYRVVLFTNAPITTQADYYATWEYVKKLFPGVDESTKDPARRLFPSVTVVAIQDTGATIPVQRGIERKTLAATPATTGIQRNLSKKTLEFIAQIETDEPWHKRFIRAAYELKSKGVALHDAADMLKKASEFGELDETDWEQLEDIYLNRDAKRFDDGSMSEVEKWVREWLARNRARYSYKTEMLGVGGERTTQDRLISRLVLDAVAEAKRTVVVDKKGNERNPAPHGQTNIEHVLNLWYAEQLDAVVAEHRAKIAYNGGSGDSLEQWLRAVTGRTNELDLAVMRHFLWQVKRKLYGKSVDWHMMPVIYGKTGGGKTVAVRQLLGPIYELIVEPQDLKVLGDSREARLFSKNFVAFFDEMAKAENVDIGALKNKITSDNITYRKLGTNAQITEPNVCTFIGASNRPVQSLFYDPTSARRFWQIDSQPLLDWASINSIDYLGLWRAVDENAECLITPWLPQIAHIQHTELRQQTTVEQWVGEEMVLDAEENMGARAAYSAYRAWCEDTGIQHPGTERRFCQELVTLGVPKRRTETGATYGLRPIKTPGQSNLGLIPGGKPK